MAASYALFSDKTRLPASIAQLHPRPCPCMVTAGRMGSFGKRSIERFSFLLVGWFGAHLQGPDCKMQIAGCSRIARCRLQGIGRIVRVCIFR